MKFHMSLYSCFCTKCVINNRNAIVTPYTLANVCSLYTEHLHLHSLFSKFSKTKFFIIMTTSSTTFTYWKFEIKINRILTVEKAIKIRGKPDFVVCVTWQFNLCSTNENMSCVPSMAVHNVCHVFSVVIHSQFTLPLRHISTGPSREFRGLVGHRKSSSSEIAKRKKVFNFLV